jgi:antitoxin ParD1/3/4
MNVSLTPELEELVNEKVRSGLYQTASEVVREALRLLKNRDDEVRRADQQALSALASGPANPPAGRERKRRSGARTRRKRR